VVKLSIPYDNVTVTGTQALGASGPGCAVQYGAPPRAVLVPVLFAAVTPDPVIDSTKYIGPAMAETALLLQIVTVSVPVFASL
jgi:hypothetical protein